MASAAAVTVGATSVVVVYADMGVDDTVSYYGRVYSCFMFPERQHGGHDDNNVARVTYASDDDCILLDRIIRTVIERQTV